MRRFFTLVFIVALAAGVAALVVKLMGESKRYAGMSEAEIRADLERKLSGKLSDEALSKIQAAVVEAIEKARPIVEQVSPPEKVATQPPAEPATTGSDQGSDGTPAAGGEAGTPAEA